MIKGKWHWAALLALCAAACTSTPDDGSRNETEIAKPRYEGSVLVDRIRALESEAATVAATKVWSAPVTGSSVAQRCWLDGKTLIVEAWNPQTREYEVYIVDAERGRSRWMLILGQNPLAFQPHFGAGTVAFMTANDNAMIVVDTKLGSRLFHKQARVQVLTSHDAVSNEDTVYVGNTLSQRVAALSAADGRKAWDFELPGLASTAPLLAWQLTSPLLVVGTSNGHVTAVDAQNWNELAPTSARWDRDFAGSVPAELNLTWISGSGENDPKSSLLLVPCEDNNLYGLDATNGRSRWVLRTDAPFKSYASCFEDRVYVRNADRMFCVDAKTGRRLWMPGGVKQDYQSTQLFGTPEGFELADRFLAQSGDKVYFLKGANTIWRCSAADGNVEGIGALPSFDFFMTNEATGSLICGTRDGIFVSYK